MMDNFKYFFPKINLRKIIFVIFISVGYGLSTIVTIYFVSNLVGIINTPTKTDLPLPIKFIIDLIMSSIDLNYKYAHILSGLFFLTLMLVLGLTKLFLISKICADARHNLSVNVLKKTLNLHSNLEDEKHQGNSKSLILDEAQQIVKQLLRPIIEIQTSSIFILVLLIYLFFYNPIITIIVFILFSITYLLNFLLVKSSIQKHGHLRFLQNKKRYAKVDDAFNLRLTSHVLKTFDLFIDRYSSLSKKMAYHQYKFDYISNAPKFVIESVVFLSVFLLIIFGYSDENLTDKNINFAQNLVVFSLTGLKMLPEFQKIFLSLGLLRFGSSSQGGTLDLLKRKDLPNLKKDFKRKEKSDEIQNYKNLIFNFTCDSCYKGETKILNNIDFKLFEGDRVAIKGKSGAGKTTLINAFMGISPIEIKGIKGIFEPEISFGYLPQETNLFSGTILENIVMGRGLTDQKFNFIKQTFAELFSEYSFDKIEELLNREIEDVSSGLSVGQKQRIGLIRAIYNNPDVLILDEFTSALDEKNEEIIINYVTNLTTYKSLIIVGHRKTSVKICKTIYNINDGNLVKG